MHTVRTKHDTKGKTKTRKKEPHTRPALHCIKRESTHSNLPPSARSTQLRHHQRHQSHSHIEVVRNILRPWYQSPCPKNRVTVTCACGTIISSRVLARMMCFFFRFLFTPLLFSSTQQKGA